MLHVVWAMGWSDFYLKYRGSLLGYLWSFVPMIIRFLVIFHVFRPFVQDRVPHYLLYLFLGLIVWQHFSDCSSGCISVLRNKEAIIRKVSFPRVTLMFAVCWQQTIIFFTNFLIFLIVAWLMGPPLGWGYLYLPVLLFHMSLLALGVGMLLSAYSLKFRDISHLWSVMLQILFWLTPIMYFKEVRAPFLEAALALVRSGGPRSLWELFDMFIRFQPLTLLMQDARRVLLYYDQIGMPTLMHIGGVTVICLGIFAVGAGVFLRRSELFVQEY